MIELDGCLINFKHIRKIEKIDPETDTYGYHKEGFKCLIYLGSEVYHVTRLDLEELKEVLKHL